MKTACEGLAALLCAGFACAGCDRLVVGRAVAEAERRDRATHQYAEAMRDLQAGRLDAASEGFLKTVKTDPAAASAHFQLGVLLQDHAKDYLGAIAHFRMYCTLRPGADKAPVANDRLFHCERLYREGVLAAAKGKDPTALENARLKEEKNALARDLDELKKSFAATNRQLAATIRADELKRGLLAKLTSGDGDGPAKNATAAEALAELRAMEERDRRLGVNPSDADLLDGDDDEASPVNDRIRTSADVKNLRYALDREESADRAARAAVVTNAVAETIPFRAEKKSKKAKVERPETYEVQPGDTLRQLARRFYGTPEKWKDIQEANKAGIPFDGRLKIGQVIRLP